MDIVASCPARSSAARALVESAVRAWRCKYPTSKVDDCAVVCLFLDSTENNFSTASITKSKENVDGVNEDLPEPPVPTGFDRSGTVRSGEETLPRQMKEESSGDEGEMQMELVGKDWSALEGVSRVNTLLTLPRYVPGREEKARK